MLCYCLNCRKNEESKAKTKYGRIILLLKCPVCDGKMSRFIEEQETSGAFRCPHQYFNCTFYNFSFLS